MSDLHVEKLFYRITSGQSVDLSQAPRATWRVLDDRFQVTLDGDEMIAEPQVHYASADDARAVLDPYLRAWEIQAALAVSTPSLQFEYQRAEVIDRHPSPGVVSAPLVINMSIFPTVSIKAVVGLATFPSPAQANRCDEATERMYRRLMGIWADGNYVTSDGYYILTEAEDRFGSRRAAARTLNIDVTVLNKIGELTSRAGGQRARKALGASRPLTSKELTWLKAALRALVLRSLEHDANQSSGLPLIEMADLPTI